MTDRISLNGPLWMLCLQMGRDFGEAAPKTLRSKWIRLKEEYKKKAQSEYGCNIAAGGFNSAALRYLQHDLVLVSPPALHDEIRRQAGLMKRMPGSIMSIPRRQIFHAMAEYGCTAWLDAAGECTVPFYIRSMTGKQFPAIVTHHSISYPHLATQVFLPLVLSETFPFDSLVCSSHSARKQMQMLLASITDELKSHFGAIRQFNGTFEVIPFGVDTNIYQPRDRNKIRKKIGLKRDAFIVISVSRISPVDKADPLPFLAIVKEIARAIHPKPLTIIIAGGSHHGYDQILKEYINTSELSSMVILPYRIPDSELPEYYSAADVFLSLSDNVQECLGVAAIEAMASGIPQVVPDWSGYRDTVDEGVTGYRIPTYWTRCDDDICNLSQVVPSMWAWSHYNLAQSVAIDLRVLRDRLVKLAIDDEKRLEMGKASVARAHSLYGWNVVMDRYSDLLSERVQLCNSSAPIRSFQRPPFIPSFFSTTSHFASSILEDDTRLLRTEVNAVPPQQSEKYIRHFSDMEACYPQVPDLFVESMPVAGTLQDFRDRVSELMSCNSSEASRYIMWLIKYGYLSVA